MKVEKDKKKYSLAIDMGNTNTKIAFAVGQTIEECSTIKANSPLPDLPTQSRIIISNVRKKDDQQAQVLRKQFPNAVWMGADTPLFFDTKTTRRDTIGSDRLAACAGALKLGKIGAPKLVITTGTCITFNYIDTEGAFTGGAISPGYQMRLDAMHHFTGKLPHIIANEIHPEYIGKDTEQNMLSGVFFGICNEIDGRILRFIDGCRHYEIFITGGHHLRLVNQSKYSIFANSNLQLLGLLNILEHQH